jgi:hypothetical protein
MLRNCNSYRRLWYVKKRNIGLIRLSVKVLITLLVVGIIHYIITNYHDFISQSIQSISQMISF